MEDFDFGQFFGTELSKGKHPGFMTAKQHRKTAAAQKKAGKHRDAKRSMKWAKLAAAGKLRTKHPTKKGLHDVSFAPVLEARKSTAAAAAQQGGNMSEVQCPHCGEGISKAYAVKALAVLAKSEGLEISDELMALAEEAEQEGDDAEKGMHGGKKSGVSPHGHVGNKVDSHRGPHKPGAMHSSTRGKGAGPGVQRANTPTNPVTEGGVRKSLFPVVDNYRAVEYVQPDIDAQVASRIEKGDTSIEPAPNHRAAREAATGQGTPE